MERIQIKASKLDGKITVPPSKSLCHRAIISAALCNDGESTINNISLSEDIKATIEGMRTLGAEINIYENKTNIKRTGLIKKQSINCMESGSTLRFLIPVGLALTDSLCFIGRKKLFERPLGVYYDIFNTQNIDYKISQEGISIKGRLLSGSFRVPGNVSSQFISGLLFSLPILHSDSSITIDGSFESRAYVDLTVEVLKRFGILIEKNNNTYNIPGRQQYKSCNYSIEGDFSQAAFFLVANELGSKVQCSGLNNSSLQGDRKILNIIDLFKECKSEVVVDASQIPDLVPVISVLAALKEDCVSTITNAQRLRIKESDRLLAISTELAKLGATVKETYDGLIIYGKKSLAGNATVNSWNDHRIAMALAIAATRCQKDIILENYTAVNKSYPNFWNDYKRLGGAAIELNDRQ